MSENIKESIETLLVTKAAIEGVVKGDDYMFASMMARCGEYLEKFSDDERSKAREEMLAKIEGYESDSANFLPHLDSTVKEHLKIIYLTFLALDNKSSMESIKICEKLIDEELSEVESIELQNIKREFVLKYYFNHQV